MNRETGSDRVTKRQGDRVTGCRIPRSVTLSRYHSITLSLSLLLLFSGCNAGPITPPPSPLQGILFINEFMASNASTIHDEAGDYDDWVELYNAGREPLDLSNTYLSDDFVRPTKWTFPDTTIPAGGYLLLWADGETAEGDLHLSFKLNAGPGERLGLYSTDGEHLFLVDTVTFGPQRTDTSLGRLPDGDDDWEELGIPTPGNANVSEISELHGTLFVNELMADNDSVIQDEAGEYNDWIELHNAGTAAVRLAGLFLTDNLSTPNKWAFPDTQVPAGGFLLVWADDEPTEGPLHATFNLGSLLGEQVGIYQYRSGHMLRVDTLTFGPQHTDTSYGRYPDAGPAWQLMPHPTPREPNQQ